MALEYREAFSGSACSLALSGDQDQTMRVSLNGVRRGPGREEEEEEEEEEETH